VAAIEFDAHLEDLKQRFPETPDGIILKADVLRDGLRFSRELGEAGAWAISSSAFLGREDVVDQELGGSVQSVPNQLILEDDTRINVELDRSSPYAVQADGNEHHVLCRNDRPVATISFCPRPDFQGTLADGSPITVPLGQRAEHCVAVVHSVFCEYAKNGDPCAYCFLGHAVETADLAGLGPENAPRPRQSIEACAVAQKEIGIEHVVVSGGAFVKTPLEARSYAKTISALRQAVGPETRITAVCQAFEEDDWVALKNAGADRVQPNLEVWHDSLWPRIIPGKAKAVGKAEWIRRLELAVDIFGIGEVATSFVAGAGLAEPSGIRTSEDAIDSHLEGYESLLCSSIVPVFGFLTKARGTRYENAELPPTDFFLRLGWERTRLMREFDMYQHYSDGVDADFSCYKCVTHKTCQDYSRLMGLGGSGTEESE
jgi:hypothetical protein